MLHLITEVGKPGYNDREKRHFPTVLNHRSQTKYKPRGRRYIPHGCGEDYQYTPHVVFIDPQYTDCGPDWKSRLRKIPSPHNDNYPAAENWPEPWKGKRSMPWKANKSQEEYMFYPEAQDTTLRAKWSGVHKATSQTQKEITDKELYGKNRIIVDKRNGLSLASPGDKAYQAVEYSPCFHKEGSTLPVVNFGGSHKKRTDTFVPLQALPLVPRESYKSKEKHRLFGEELDEVKSLERWRAATPLAAPSTDTMDKPRGDTILIRS